MAVTTATIALWCNGNTADFGSVIRGSSPRGATKLKLNDMITKYDIGEQVCLFDFDDEKVVFGTIVCIQAYASKQWKSDLSDTFSQVEIIYDVSCSGCKYERREKHLFKSVDECRAYYLDHIKI